MLVSVIMEFRWLELLLGRSTGRYAYTYRSPHRPIEIYQWVYGQTQWGDRRAGECLLSRGRRLVITETGL